MNGLDQLRQMWGGLDAEQRKALVGIGIAHAVLVTIGFRSLARTPAERIRGPRWLWKVLMPSSTLKINDDNVIFAPTGVVAYFLVGRKWKKPAVESD